MGIKTIEVQLPPNYSDDDLQKEISKKLNIRNFSYEYELKSIDARNKNRIFWNIRLRIISEEIKDNINLHKKQLEIPTVKGDSNEAVIVGSGPAGYFCALVLQMAGFKTTIIEKGASIEKRIGAIDALDSNGLFNAKANYCIGEGGAGTFSDGKLTSRTKNIAAEKEFVFNSYVEAGAPQEILYLAHPHIGSNRLQGVVKNLRSKYMALGGKIHFDSEVIGIKSNGKIVQGIEMNNGQIDTPLLVFAPGNSSFFTYRMLLNAGVEFQVKPFALGFRAEHLQSDINQSQWGKTSIKGLKSAEYFLTASGNNQLPVYSFCMCPGGKVINASADNGLAVVNGMSDYERDGKYANAAIVAAYDLNKYKSAEVSASEALDWLETLERNYFNITQNSKAAAVRISDFVNHRISQNFDPTSYASGLSPYDPDAYLPAEIVSSIRNSLNGFIQKNPRYAQGVLIGLESKTSSIVRALRDENGRNPAFNNLWICGEGSGFAGGITSSAVDGIKTAFAIIRQFV